MSVSQAMRHAGGEGMECLLLTNSAAAREDWYYVAAASCRYGSSGCGRCSVSVMKLFLPNLLRDLEGVLMPLRLKIGIHSCINDEQAWSAFCSPGLDPRQVAGVRASIADAPKLFAIAEKSTFGNFTMSVR